MKSHGLLLVATMGIIFLFLVGCSGQQSAEEAKKFYNNGATDKSDTSDESVKTVVKQDRK